MENIKNMRDENISELVDLLYAHLRGLDYSEATIMTNKSILSRLVKYAEYKQTDKFTIELGRDFVQAEFGHLLGEKDCSHNVNRAIHMLADFQRYGMVFKQSSLTSKGFTHEYKSLFESFLEYLRKQGLCDNSIITWRGRLFRLEYYLLNRSIERFEQIGIPHINEYIESLAGFSNSTVSATLGCLRRLFTYAYENGHHPLNYSGVIPTVRRTKAYRLPNIFTPDDVAKILKSSNRDYPIGKRNFAVLILVARTGLRVSDARGLRFSDIDWDAKTISIIQQKTHKAIELPLFEDVGWAIIDYLKHGRPVTECEHVFVSHQAPYTKLKSSFQKTVVEAVCAAGIHIDANKPIGMHTFRHSIATAMLASGAKITDIAPALGHIKPESTEHYISTTVDMLRECALEVSL